jgi:type IV pilus assembly protein PilO
MQLGIRGLLALGVVVGLPLASYFMVFKPANKDREMRLQNLAHQEDLLTKLREETKKNTDLQSANEEIKKTVAAIEARLPSNKEMDGVVRQISDLAVQAGLEAPSMKSVKPVQAALYMEQPIELEVGGTFVGLFTFLAQLEKLPRITRISDMKITAGLQPDQQEVKAEFTLSIYFQDEKRIANVEVK